MNGHDSPQRGKSVPANLAARRLIEGLDKGGNLERARAVAVWREIAGTEVSSHARGFAMRVDGHVGALPGGDQHTPR
jgi:hypothetical protein